MKLRDLTEFDRDDILGALGLQTRSSTAGWLFGSLGLFGLGIVVGAGVALVLAPKTGTELRREIEGRIKTMCERIGNGAQSLESNL
jgi:gas vesicle protein